MRKFLLIQALLMLSVLGSLVSGQGYDIQPEDALIIPVGVSGTPYVNMELGTQGGILRLSTNEDPKGWNHCTAHETSTTGFTRKQHRGLIGYDHISGALIPDLAKRWEVSEDNLTVVFYLREGIKWSDGTSITADDILFTYNDIILNEDVDTNLRDSQVLPDGTYPVCEKINDYVIAFTMSVAFRPALNSLTFEIMPRHILSQYVHKLNPRVPAGSFNEAWTLSTDPSDLVGNGPWIVSDYVPNSSVTMTRNPYYYGYDPSGTQLPYYDAIVTLIVTNRDVSMLKFRNAEIDAYRMRPEDIAILLPEGAHKGFTTLVTDQPTYGTRWFMINQDIGLSDGSDEKKRELYRTTRFREALAHLIDKNSIIQLVGNGLGAPQWSPVSVPSPFYAGREYYGGPITERDAVWFEYDPGLAVSILNELGVVDSDGDGWRNLPNGEPLQIEINTSDNTMGVATCQIYEKDLQLVGLNATFQIIAFNTLVDRLFSSSGDIIALGLTGGDEPHEGANVYRSCGALHAYRYSACSDPDGTDRRIDELISLGAGTFDLDKAFAYYKEYQQLLARQLGYVYTVVSTFIYAYYDHVGNAFMSNPVSIPHGSLAEVCFDGRL